MGQKIKATKWKIVSDFSIIIHYHIFLKTTCGNLANLTQLTQEAINILAGVVQVDLHVQRGSRFYIQLII